MGRPAAKQGDQITATDTHYVMVSQPSGPPVATPLPHAFAGVIDGGLSSDVNVMGRPAAMVGSTADNKPPHVPTAPGEKFQNPPTNKGTIQSGSETVRINGKAAARDGDTAKTCDDVSDLAHGTVVATGTVLVG